MLRREIDRPLRRDVRLLGQLLGEVLIEQEGRELFDLEERVRKLAIRRRRGPKDGRAEAGRELTEVLAGVPVERIEPLIRAFSVYFRLVNLAEQHHRIRRARAHASDPDAPPQRGSLRAILRAAKEAGIAKERVREAIDRLEVTLTVTAHPTEAARRTVLEKLYRIAKKLEERDRTRQVHVERRRTHDEIREEITILWQTDELRRARPTVGDEVKNVLWYVEEILWDVLPELRAQLEQAFEQVYGEPLGPASAPLRIHSWVGGDMDGNPFVTPDVLLDAIRAYRARGLRRLVAAVRELGSVLSQSSRHVKPPARLVESIAADLARTPGLVGDRELAGGEPWRQKLSIVEARLVLTLADVERRRTPSRWAGETPESSGGASLEHRYRRPSELLADVALVADTLREAAGEHAGQRRAQALVDRVRSFGFSAAELELRTHANDVRDAVAFLDGRGELGEGGKRLLEALDRVREGQREAGEEACRTLIISMAGSVDDVLGAFRCAREAGLWDSARGCALVDVVPLFETGAALSSSGAIVKQMWAEPTYRRHVEARGVQEVMVGYSDSGKEAGLLAASAALYRAERALVAAAREAGIRLRLFHGRGESVARGGGPAQEAILALPSGSVAGAYKATEQGEALDHKFGRPELAMRTLELVVGGALLHTLDAQPKPSPEDEARFVATFEELAEVGRRAYRSLVWEEPLFVEFFRAATPVDELARLPIGSRPSKRHAGGLEALRAIPWSFAWTQNRAIVPGWYGVGSALEAVGSRPGGPELLAEMHARWPYFRAVLDNVEMVLAKSDLAIASRYAKLAPAEAREAVWPRIRDEHARTVRWVKRIHGVGRLLDGNPPLQRSIRLRNPYVDPMSFSQITLVACRRAGDERCDRPLLLTINGIAAGMRNTG